MTRQETIDAILSLIQTDAKLLIAIRLSATQSIPLLSDERLAAIYSALSA